MASPRRTAALLVWFAWLAAMTAPAAAANPPLAGTAAPLWLDRFGTPGANLVNNVIELANGDVLATGYVSDAGGAALNWDLFARRYTAAGRLLWSRRIGGAGLDAGWAAVESGGRIAIAGPSASGGAGEEDAWLLVLGPGGETLIDRRYGGPAEDFVTGLAAAPDGGFVLAGWTQNGSHGGRDVLLLRTDAAGNELWRRSYGGPAMDRGFYARHVAGGYVVAGVTGTPEDYDFLLMKVDDAGTPLWQRVVGGPGNDPVHGLGILPDGRILLLGYTRSWNARDYDLAALTFSPDGRLLRHAQLGGPGDDRVQYGATAPGGSTWVVGRTTSFSGGPNDMLLARVGRDGRFEPWLGAVGTAAEENGAAIAVARNGDLLIGGSSGGADGAAPHQAILLRLRPRGIVRRTDGVAVADLPPGPDNLGFRADGR